MTALEMLIRRPKEPRGLDLPRAPWHHMGMPKRSSKPPETDVDAPADEPAPAQEEPPAKNPAAVALGRMGGLKGGKARAASLSKKKRSEIAQKAAKARWGTE